MISLKDNDFALFEVKQQFAQDRAALDARWKDLQRQAHPDKFASHGAAAQRVAMQWSVRINEAYQRLKDPLKRAAYLCELQGAPVGAHSNTAMPAHFLMQQMQWREEMDDAKDAIALATLFEQVQSERHALLGQCEVLLDTAHDYPAAVGMVRALMFVDKFLRDLTQRMDALE